MKSLLKFFMCIVSIVLTGQSFAQKPDLDKKTNQIKSLHKSKDLVLESALVIIGDSVSVTDEFYLPKGKYVLYALIDNDAIKQADFFARWDSMEGDTKDTSKRTIVKQGKGLKAQKFIITNTEKIESGFAIIEFKIDDIMNLLTNTGNRIEAKKNGSSFYTKYENGAVTRFTFKVAKENFIQESDRQVKILVYER